MPRNSRRKAGRVVRNTLADGAVREYRYAPYRGPKRVSGENLGTLIKAYRRSPEWAGLKPHTRQTSNIYLMPLERLEHLRAKDIKRRDIPPLRDAIASSAVTAPCLFATPATP